MSDRLKEIEAELRAMREQYRTDLEDAREISRQLDAFIERAELQAAKNDKALDIVQRLIEAEDRGDDPADWWKG